MELKLLSENKLKIVLTNEDMAKMDITCEEMDYDGDTNTKRVFWEILDYAKRQTGFDAASGPVAIRVEDKKDDGCSILVTKTGAYKRKRAHEHEGHSGASYTRSYSPLYTSAKKKRLIYMFEDSDGLLEACRQLTLAGYDGKSDIFASEHFENAEGRYYLYIEDNHERSLSLISEYGLLINNPIFACSLDEHAKKILSSDAVQTFAELFS